MGEAREDAKSFHRNAHEKPHLLLEQLAKTQHQRCHCAMPGPVRSGIGAAASGTPGAIGLSVAGAVLHSAGFGGTVLLARCQSRDAGARSSLLQRILEARGATARQKLWKVAPKLHLFLHLCEWQSVSLGNRRFFWCHSDEDMVGQLVEVAESCHPSTMSTTALFKWLTFVSAEDHEDSCTDFLATKNIHINKTRT